MKSARIAASLVLVLASSMAFAQSKSSAVEVKAQVKGACQIVESAEINFNLLDPTETTDKTATGTLKFWCTRGVPYTLSMDSGQNAEGTVRRMKSTTTATEFVAYEIGTVVLTGSGQGPLAPTTVSLPATVRASAYRNAAIGSYKDTLTVTVAN